MSVLEDTCIAQKAQISYNPVVDVAQIFTSIRILLVWIVS